MCLTSPLYDVRYNNKLAHKHVNASRILPPPHGTYATHQYNISLKFNFPLCFSFASSSSSRNRVYTKIYRIVSHNLRDARRIAHTHTNKKNPKRMQNVKNVKTLNAHKFYTCLTAYAYVYYSTKIFLRHRTTATT